MIIRERRPATGTRPPIAWRDPRARSTCSATITVRVRASSQRFNALPADKITSFLRMMTAQKPRVLRKRPVPEPCRARPAFPIPSPSDRASFCSSFGISAFYDGCPTL
ncbi:MAG: hypothetical protein MZV70_08300 [Desulfobacterales bacterium]|nr:hypothetical protein [Desulfobacterales bacterium]